MISERLIKLYCNEDISFIENYEQALNDDKLWDCHHKLEIYSDYRNSVKDLKLMNLYYNRPACEFIFLPHSEHQKLHKLGITISLNQRNKLSISRLGMRYTTSEFGKKFKEHYGITCTDNKKLYNTEMSYYRRHNNTCRWELNETEQSESKE